MSKLLSRISTAFLAGRELGWKTIRWYLLYQLGLRSGHYRRQSLKRSQTPALPAEAYRFSPVIHIPGRDRLLQVMGETSQARLIAEADEIVAGKLRLFGALETALNFGGTRADRNWTELASGSDETDIKLLWEPARFGWAFTLGRAYRLTGADRYPDVFWKHFEIFEAANPPEMGLQWESAQEVALRLIAYTFAAQVFMDANPTTTERMRKIGLAIAAHARRLPSTLPYARAQGNNHLLTEAAGLYMAGCALTEHPQAEEWRKLGLQVFAGAVLDQFTQQGEYVQHSTNYHRLALQVGLWMSAVTQRRGESLPSEVQERLGAGTRWLMKLIDPISGQTPNLGPNDGAYIFPFTTLPIGDFRPVLQAASRQFIGTAAFPPGEWDEMAIWFGDIPDIPATTNTANDACSAPHRLEHPGIPSWCYLRTAAFHSRPGHADQLHLDLWVAGQNLAIDPGTYLYNAAYPWDNSLASAIVHNTLTVDGRDQMRRAGKFLWLRWAQAKVLDCREQGGRVENLRVEHNGYRDIGVTHLRNVEPAADGWLVTDRLVSVGKKPASGVHGARLHWLLPDLPWSVHDEADGISLRVECRYGTARVEIRCPAEVDGWRLACAGELLAGSGKVLPFEGWFSPTYTVKLPALSLAVSFRGELPVEISSRWVLKQGSSSTVKTNLVEDVN